MIWRFEMTQTELALFFVGGLSLAMLAVAGLVFCLSRHPRHSHHHSGKRHK